METGAPTPAPTPDTSPVTGSRTARETTSEAAPGPGPAAYCGHCGEPADAPGHERCAASLELEPPRYCTHCRRRMVVQVVPTGWSAKCVEHGTITAG